MTEEELYTKWQARADLLGGLGALVDPTSLIEPMLIDVRTVLDGRQVETLSLAEAAQASGYSAAHLARLVRQGSIPDPRPAGTHGRIIIRRRDLPKKPTSSQVLDADVHDLASRLTRGRKEGHHGHS